jgi:glycosyltransferase involved in cell wall biosynthesis
VNSHHGGLPRRLSLHVVLPNDIDDPARPSGGNVYDRRLIDGLAARGWVVREHAVVGDWPHPEPPARADLAITLAAIPDGALVVLDGLVASTAPEVLVPHMRRLALLVLVHMPLGDTCPDARDQEREALRAAVAVVTMSRWSRDRLVELYDLPPDRIHLAAAGVDAAPVAPGTPAGTDLLCVAAVTRHKGHDVLLRALALVPELPWRCVFVGALDREPAFVAGLRHWAAEHGLARRIRFVGARSHADVRARYARADLLVLASRGETYPLSVMEALAGGLPVLATAVGGLPEAMGHAPDGSRPGLLVPVGDALALAGALRRWLSDPELRERLRASARGRRTTLRRWSSTVDAVVAALSAVTRDAEVHSGR